MESLVKYLSRTTAISPLILFSSIHLFYYKRMVERFHSIGGIQKIEH
jgi:hypothetical protein